MRFGSGTKVLFDTDVQLAGAHFEPATATRTQCLGLLNFFKPQQSAKEVPCLSLASFRSGDLYVINPRHQHVFIILRLIQLIRGRDAFGLLRALGWSILWWQRFAFAAYHTK